MEEDLISIIVPVYNVEPYIKRCVDSIIEQTYKNIEIILVDDGSPDNCPKICDEYAKKDNRIKVIHKENGGQSDARNIGIKLAKGKYITFVDSDDYVSNDYIEYLYTILKENHADISISSVKVVNNNSRGYDMKERILNIYNKEQAFDNVLYSEGIEVAVYAKLYPREFFNDIKFPVGEKYEDIAIIYKLINKAEKIVYGDKVGYFYYTRVGSTSKSGFNQNELDYIKNVNEMLSFIEERYPQLNKGILRYRVYSQFRILRIILFSEIKNDSIQDQMIMDIKGSYNKVLKDKRTPNRDKIAIVTLKMGLPIFKMAWYIYSKLTGRVL